MKRVLATAFSLLFACGPESPTPAAPEAPGPSAQATTSTAPAPTRDRAAKAKATFLAVLAAANAHDASRIREHYAVDAVKGTASPDGWREAKGVDMIEKQTAAMLASTSDIQWKSVRVFQRDDVIIDEYVVVGTHGANGKRAGLRGVGFHWFDDAGKIKREHVYIDQLTMLIHTGRAEGRAPEPMAVPSANAAWIVAKNDATEEANLATFKATWPAKALVARDFQHDDVGTGVLSKSAPSDELAVDQAWAFGNYVVSEMQSKGTDGVARHVAVVAEHANGQVVRTTLYSNRLEGRGIPRPGP